MGSELLPMDLTPHPPPSKEDFHLRTGELRIARVQLTRTLSHMTNPLYADNSDLRQHHAPSPVGSPLILVVENHEDTRLMLRIILEMTGMRVAEAEDGPTGVRVAEETCPDLILMDWSLPRMDGLAATRLIHECDSLRQVPILMISGHAAPASKEIAFAAGCCEYLVKPFGLEEMEKLIRKHLTAH